MSSPTKVLFLEMDAGDKMLIQSWAAEGVLPTFRHLLDHGLVGDTFSLDGFFVGSIWPSLYTGTSPARHGIYGLVQLKPGTYDYFRCRTGEHIKREPFWNYLSEAGRRVAIFDVPLSGISEGLNGIQSVEWGAHDANYGFMTWPESLKDDIEKRFGLHPLTESCNRSWKTPQDYAVFRDILVEGVRTKAELTKHYLNQGNWDFFGQVFSESHCVGHQCWHLHDRDHPAYDLDMVAVTGDPIRDVYTAIDAAIGAILEQVDDDTIVVVLAGHRMSYKYGAQFLFPEVLVRLNAAVRPPSYGAEAQSTGVIDKIDSVLTWGWQQTPDVVKTLLQPVRKGLRSAIDGPPTEFRPPELDHENSKCFLLDIGFPVGGVRVNLKGREPAGLVAPGREMETFLDHLSDDLMALKDLDTGKPVVRRIRRTADLYQGEYLDLLPDILVDWSDDKPLGSSSAVNQGGSHLRIGSDKAGVVEGTNAYCRTGDHRPEGLFMAIGPGIAPGRLDRVVSIMDFAPTFTRLLGVDMPDLDGHPIAEIVASPAG